MKYLFRTEKHNNNTICIETRGVQKGTLGFRGDAFGQNTEEGQAVWRRFEGDDSKASALIFLGVLREFIKDVELRGWVYGKMNLEILLNEQDLIDVFPSLRRELLLHPLTPKAKELYASRKIR